MAREGLLLGADGEKAPPSAPGPEKPKKKWENFWYYHKWHIVFAAAGVMLAVFLMKDLFSPRADYEIGMITESSYPEEAAVLLEQEIAKSAEDLNGDGRVIVQINPYPIPSGEEGARTELQAAARIKLDADLAAGQSFLFLTDPESFGRQQEEQKLFARTDGTTPPEGQADPTEMRIPLSKLGALSGLSYKAETASGGEEDLFQNLGLSLRIYHGSSAEGKEDAYWQASVRLLRKLAA